MGVKPAPARNVLSGNISDTSLDKADVIASLADACDDMGFAIEARRRQDGFNEPSDIADRIISLERNLRTQALTLRTLGVSLLLQQAQAELPLLTKATTDAKRVTAHLQTIQAVITISGLVLSVAAGAISGNLGAIATSVAALAEAVKPLIVDG